MPDDAGFPVFNASPLQFLFFDDLDEAFFVQGARAGALRRSLKALDRVEARLEKARERFAANTGGRAHRALCSL